MARRSAVDWASAGSVCDRLSLPAPNRATSEEVWPAFAPEGQNRDAETITAIRSVVSECANVGHPRELRTEGLLSRGSQVRALPGAAGTLWIMPRLAVARGEQARALPGASSASARTQSQAGYGAGTIITQALTN